MERDKGAAEQRAVDAEQRAERVKATADRLANELRARDEEAARLRAEIVALSQAKKPARRGGKRTAEEEAPPEPIPGQTAVPLPGEEPEGETGN